MKPLLKVLCLLLLTLSVVPSWAQDKDLVQVPISAAPSYAKVALVIGINDYQFTSKLGMCVNDANAMTKFLQTKMGFTRQSITLMTDAPGGDKRLEPTYTKMRRAIEAFIESVDEKSEVVFFYSGHGVRLNNEDYLVPQDGSAQDIATTCINYNALKNRLETKNPRRVLLIVDACRNVFDGKGDGGSGFGDGAAPREPQFAELRSCRPTEKSLEGKPEDFRAGVFTHYLLQGLSGDPEAVAPGTKNVTFDSLRYYVRGKVNQYVTANYVGYRQNPIGYSSLGSMVLAQSTLKTPQPQPVPSQPVQPSKPVKPASNQQLRVGSTKANSRDGAEMVWVPAGEFLMGSNGGSEDEKPQRRVYLDGYWIYRNLVTVAQYRRFCQATERQMPDAPEWGWQENHPVVKVSWDDASAYCKWAGTSLPTEAQWEKAARGGDGRDFPWGNKFLTSNLWSSKKELGDVERSAPVGSFPAGASPYGALDMAGNVWQWCVDWYNPDYYNKGVNRNPMGPAPDADQVRVIRGGSWADFESSYFRTSKRFFFAPADRDNALGFRCVQSRP
jgi:formylglycine-generating enzyme required for sulfatase activity